MTVQQLQEKIAANSKAWHYTDDQKERERLHQENVALHAQLDGQTGSTSSFDPDSGRWTVTAPGEGRYQGTGAPEVQDLSQLVRERQEAATRQAIAQLSRAKAQSEAALQAEEAAIGPAYQAAKDRTAAQNEIGRKNMGEWASDKGLSVGSAGQIALSESVAAQSDLNQLELQEAQALDKVRRDRSEMERDYAYAVAEAQAEGDYALAQALYEEASRFDAAQRQLWRDREAQYQDIYALNREGERYDTSLLLEQEERDYQRLMDDFNKRYKLEERDYQRQQDALDRQEQQAEAAFDREMAREASAQKWQSLQDARDKWQAQAASSGSGASGSGTAAAGASGSGTSASGAASSDDEAFIGVQKTKARLKAMWEQLMGNMVPQVK